MVRNCRTRRRCNANDCRYATQTIVATQAVHTTHHRIHTTRALCPSTRSFPHLVNVPFRPEAPCPWPQPTHHPTGSAPAPSQLAHAITPHGEHSCAVLSTSRTLRRALGWEERRRPPSLRQRPPGTWSTWSAECSLVPGTPASARPLASMLVRYGGPEHPCGALVGKRQGRMPVGGIGFSRPVGG